MNQAWNYLLYSDERSGIEKYNTRESSSLFLSRYCTIITHHMSSIIFEIYVILLFASIFFPENILISFNLVFFVPPCITTLNKSQLNVHRYPTSLYFHVNFRNFIKYKLQNLLFWIYLKVNLARIWFYVITFVPNKDRHSFFVPYSCSWRKSMRTKACFDNLRAETYQRIVKTAKVTP